MTHINIAAFRPAYESGISTCTKEDPRAQTDLEMDATAITSNAIEVCNLSFAYSGRKVLNDINFAVERGVICGFLGPNGSGKTTLLKCINGLRTPVSGQIIIEGSLINSMTRREIASKISVVPQQANIVFPFKSIDLVIMGRCSDLEAWESPGDKDYTQAETLMESLGIGHLSYRRVTEISGGERQLVMIARAIFQGADIMLLDEPTAHLDYRNQFSVLRTVTDVARRKRLTVIITLHNPNLAFHYCNKILLLKEGRIISEGSSDSVFQGQILSKLYDMDISIANVSERTCQIVLPSDW